MTTPKEEGERPAFPSASGTALWFDSDDYGLTIRQMYKMAIIQGLCANPDISMAMAKEGLSGSKSHPRYSAAASKLADALIQEDIDHAKAKE